MKIDNNSLDISNVLESSDIGSTVEGYDATILKSADIGSTVQGYDANILVSGDIGSTVQGYDANILVSGDIGTTVQGYDATILVDADIGVTVQAPLTAGTDYRKPSVKLAKSGTTSVVAGDSGKIIYNTAATDISLPSGFDGAEYDFVVKHASYLKIITTNGEKIRYLANLSAANGYIRCQTIGNTAKVAWVNDEWVCIVLQAVVVPWTMDA